MGYANASQARTSNVRGWHAYLSGPYGRLANVLRDNRFKQRANSRNALFLNAGISRYIFTTDVSVYEGQAFIRDLVLVLGWFRPLDRYGR